jgi:hypothetical protein
MTTQKRVDVRITDPELLIILEKIKARFPNLNRVEIIKMFAEHYESNGNSQLKIRFEDLHDYSKRIKSNDHFPRMILLFSQIATFGPILQSPEKCKYVCEDLENLLISYLKNFRGGKDL